MHVAISVFKNKIFFSCICDIILEMYINLGTALFFLDIQLNSGRAKEEYT